MSGDIALVLLANALLLVAGLGALAAIGAVENGRELLTRGGLGYLVGLALGGILAATLAVVQLPAGLPAVAALAGVMAAAGSFRLRGRWRADEPRRRRSLLEWAVAGGSVAAMAAVLVHAGRAFLVAPLYSWDAWAIWAAKARDLYLFGGADLAIWGHVWGVANREYPLLLPGLEALDFHAAGEMSARLLHLQMLLFAPALLAALLALLSDLVPWLLLWPALLAITFAPGLLLELARAYADVPLACFVAVGAVAAARWLLRGEGWALALAALFFGAALVTKSEGLLFVIAAYVALALTARSQGRRLRSVGVAALASIAIFVPWRLYTAIYDIHDGIYRLSDSFHVIWVAHRLGRGPIALHDLVSKLVLPSQWGLLVAGAMVAVVAALAARRRVLPVFAIVFALVSLAGLTWIYLISRIGLGDYLGSTTSRVTASLALTLAALAPLMAAEAWRRAAIKATGESESDHETT